MGDRRVIRDLARQLWQQAPLLLALIALWMLLWGSVSLLSVVSGLVVAIGVTRFFYLPPVELGGRLNLFWLLVFLGRFAVDLARASIIVSAQAFGPRVTGNSILAVPLRSTSDFIMTTTAIAVSLVPGSLVLEIDRATSTLYIHVLGARSEKAIDRARRAVLGTEERLVRAVGSRADLARVTA